MGADDERFLERLRQRDEAAFAQLVERNQGPIYRLLLRMLRNPAEAEDVAQDVFVSAFKALDSFRGESALSTWLYRIAQNHAKNRIKYLARRTRDTARTPISRDEGTPGNSAQGPEEVQPDTTALAHEAERHLEQALAQLDDDQRELIELRDAEHLSYDEIVQLTGLPLGTVKSRLHRARLALAQRFSALQEGQR
jgi:RNA polymerase sigma-70 factor (ECF subfamily)